MSTVNTDINDKVFGASPDDLRALKAAYGAVVKRHRIQAGISQVTLASMVGISRSHIYGIETGQGNPVLTTQHRIAAALGTTISEISENALVEAFGSEE